MWRFAETNREKRRKIRRKVYAFHLTDFWDSRSLYVRASACVEISQRNASILLTADRQFWSALKLGISPDGYGNPTVVTNFARYERLVSGFPFSVSRFPFSVFRFRTRPAASKD